MKPGKSRTRRTQTVFLRKALNPLLRKRLETAERALGIRVEELDLRPAVDAPDFSTLDSATIHHWRNLIAVLQVSATDLSPLSRVFAPSPTNSGSYLEAWLADRAYFSALDEMRRADEVRRLATRAKANKANARRKRGGQSTAALQGALNAFVARYPIYRNLNHEQIAKAFLQVNKHTNLSWRTIVNLTRHPNPLKRRVRIKCS